MPTDFEFTNGKALIIIGDIGLFPQPGLEGLPGIGIYPGVLVGWGDPIVSLSADNGSAIVSVGGTGRAVVPRRRAVP